MLSSSLNTMLTASKTTSSQKLFRSDCITRKKLLTQTAVDNTYNPFPWQIIQIVQTSWVQGK